MTKKEMSFREMVKQGDIEGVRASIGKVKNINRRNCYGQTLLHQVGEDSCGEPVLGVIKELIKRGADVNARDNRERTPLHAVMVREAYDDIEHVGEAKALIEAGASVNARDDEGQTPLHKALGIDSWSDGRWCMLKALIEAGADVNVKTGARRSPLFMAYTVEDVQLLIEAGADMNERDSEGETTLFEAMHDGFLEIAEYLIDKGADLSVRNRNGDSVLDIASGELLNRIQSTMAETEQTSLQNNLPQAQQSKPKSGAQRI